MNILEIENVEYRYELRKKSNSGNVALGIVSYLPTKETIPLLKVCIASIRKFYGLSVDVWVCDNNSPPENLIWLESQTDINLILNKTTPMGGSVANGVGLELILHHLDNSVGFFMSLHQDIAFTSSNGINYLLSKMGDKVKAAGVRRDTKRVRNGVLHVLGYLIDVKTFREHRLSYMPKLPEYDVGDKAIVDLVSAGFQFFNSLNSHSDPEIKDRIKAPYSMLNVDRSIDDNDDVFFLHLGRGVLKSTGEHVDQTKSIDLWVNFAVNELKLELI